MRPVEITIRTPERAFEALKHIATNEQERTLAAAIVHSRDKGQITMLLHFNRDSHEVLSTPLLKRAAERFLKPRTKVEERMEVFSLLPAVPKLARIRMALFKHLLKQPIKVWLTGYGIGHNVHSHMFRKNCGFLPVEIEMMVRAVTRSRNHVWVDRLLDFRPGHLLSGEQYEFLSTAAIRFHANERKRSKKAA